MELGIPLICKKCGKEWNGIISQIIKSGCFWFLPKRRKVTAKPSQ